MYVYIQSETGLYTVGFYDPQGKWIPESDHSDKSAAAARVSYLNGNDWTKAELDKPLNLVCQHSWVDVGAVNETFEYCRFCGERRNK